MDPKKTEFKKALDSLTRYLAIRDHSRFELEQKLARKFERETVGAVLEAAVNHGWLLDESSMAERLVNSLQAKNKSRQYIEAQLRKRRLPLPAINEDRELESIRSLAQRKFGGEKLSYDDKIKAFRFFKYRGFSDQLIRQVLNDEP